MIGVSARVPKPIRAEEDGGAKDDEERPPLSNRQTSSVSGSTSISQSWRASAAAYGTDEDGLVFRSLAMA